MFLFTVATADHVLLSSVKACNAVEDYHPSAFMLLLHAFAAPSLVLHYSTIAKERLAWI